MKAPVEVLFSWKKMLKPNGVLLLAMNNRFGIRYFCVYRDRYTNSSFDGVDGYSRYGSVHNTKYGSVDAGVDEKNESDIFRGRMYSRYEIQSMLQKAGFENQKFYSVLSNLEYPSHLIADGYTPNEDLANRLYPSYYSPETVFLEEEALYQSLLCNNMFHQMANAYLIEAAVSNDTKLSDALQVNLTVEDDKPAPLFAPLSNKSEKKTVTSSAEISDICLLPKHGFLR